MKALEILLLGVAALAIDGCAHTAPRPPVNAAASPAPSLNDSDAQSLRLLQSADLAKAAGDRASATKLYTDALNLQPANGAAWFSLGTNYLHQNDIDLAEVALQEAVRRDPTMQKAWSNLALAHLQEFRMAARNALAGTQVTAANRDALSSMLADADRTLGAIPNSTPSGH
jgi:Tfp pilus assembly protein PilF